MQLHVGCIHVEELQVFTGKIAFPLDLQRDLPLRFCLLHPHPFATSLDLISLENLVVVLHRLIPRFLVFPVRREPFPLVEFWPPDVQCVPEESESSSLPQSLH